MVADGRDNAALRHCEGNEDMTLFRAGDCLLGEANPIDMSFKLYLIF